MNHATAYPRRTGAPSAAPLVLADVLVHLRADSDAGANDAYITSLIAVARDACEQRTGRTLIETPYSLTLDGFSSPIELRCGPVMSVQSVTYIDANGASQTLAAEAYQMDLARDPARIVPAYGAEWPATRDQLASVVVAFKAGYGATAAAVPESLRHWLLLCIGEMYATRNAGGERPSVPHAFADNLLNLYRVWPI